MNRSTINLHLGDSLEAMKLMEDNAYDLAIVDPPYGIGVNMENLGRRKGEVKKYTAKDWDSSAPKKEYFEQLKRVSKNQIIWGANHFIENIPNANSSCWIVWNKMMTGDVPFSKAEIALTSFNTSLNMVNISVQSVGDKRIHPTQKPVKLYEWLLTNYAKEGDKILDTHGGSMSIAIACHNLKFDLDLWELDEDYYNAGVKRFEQHKKQLQLF
jgi:site-specific DNA-methyltransferase (adenine-specific)